MLLLPLRFLRVRANRLCMVQRQGSGQLFWYQVPDVSFVPMKAGWLPQMVEMLLLQ